FPGETDADFDETLLVARQARFANAFTYQYSKRPGTPAATMPDQVPKEIVQDRYDRLTGVLDAIAWEGNRALVGRRGEVSVGGGGRGRLSGRARDGRLVHVTANDAAPGDTVTAEVTYAAPHHLVADGPIHGHARWRGPASAAAAPTRALLPLTAIGR